MAVLDDILFTNFYVCVDNAHFYLYNKRAKLIKYCKLGIIFFFKRDILFLVAQKFEFDKMQIPAFVRGYTHFAID